MKLQALLYDFANAAAGSYNFGNGNSVNITGASAQAVLTNFVTTFNSAPFQAGMLHPNLTKAAAYDAGGLVLGLHVVCNSDWDWATAAPGLYLLLNGTSTSAFNGFTIANNYTGQTPKAQVSAAVAACLGALAGIAFAG